MAPTNYKKICHLPGKYSKAAFPKAAFVVKKTTPLLFTAKVLLASSRWYYDFQKPINALNAPSLLTKISYRDIKKKIPPEEKTTH